MGAVTYRERERRLRRAIALLGDHDLRVLVGGIGDGAAKLACALLGLSSARQLRATPPAQLRARALGLAASERARLAYVLVQPCATRAIELLGDSHEDPSVGDMERVLDELCAGFGVAVVRLMLAAYAAEGFRCQATFDHLLGSDTRFREDDRHERFGVAQKAEPPTAVGDRAQLRERRRARRAADRAARAQRRSRAAATRPRPRRRRVEHTRIQETPAGAPATSAAERERASVTSLPLDSIATSTAGGRRPVGLVRQYRGVRHDDPLVGRVVIAEVRFGGNPGSKRRPVVVVAASRSHVVVRPCYSDGGFRSYDWRSFPVRDWLQAGLDHASWISHEERLIRRSRLGPVIGELSDHDWSRL